MMTETTEVTWAQETPPIGLHDIGFLMNNLTGEIDQQKAEELKYGMVCAGYAGWNFYGTVWYDRVAATYRCLVKCYGVHQATVSSPSLEEIMEACCGQWGND